MNKQIELHKGVGVLIANLKSLEFVLRLFLVEISKKNNPSKPFHYKIHDYEVGEEVNENPFTNYDSLNQVINKVNAILSIENINDKMDLSVVDIRDALAHGRISSINPEGPYRLLKFSKPNGGKVKVTMSFDFTLEWVSEQVKKTYSEVMKLKEISNRLGLNIFANTQ
jgi:hypothetical protein